MRKDQIAAQLYTIREFAQTAEALDASLAKIKAIGYPSVQVSGLGPIDPKTVKEIADKHGLSICATHVPYDRLLTDLDALIEEHRLWNSRYVGLGSMPQAYRTEKTGYVKLAEDFKSVGKRLHEAGMEFIYHNHKFEFEKFDGQTGMDLLMESSDSETFGFELDTYWAQAGGADPAAWIRKLKGRMKVVHLKDMAIVQDKQEFAEIGEGNMNWKEILAACDEIGVEWFIVEQDTCRRDPFESLAISYQALSRLAAD